MNWLVLSLLSCLLWGMAGILGAQAAKLQSNAATILLYNGAMLVMAVCVFLSQAKTAHFDRSAVPFAIGAGLCSAIAVLLQFVAFGRSQDKFPLIIIVGSLYPAVVMLFSTLSGHKFSLTQWLGFIFAILAITLVSLPQKVTTP